MSMHRAPLLWWEELEAAARQAAEERAAKETAARQAAETRVAEAEERSRALEKLERLRKA